MPSWGWLGFRERTVIYRLKFNFVFLCFRNVKDIFCKVENVENVNI